MYYILTYFILFTFQNDVTLQHDLMDNICHKVVTQINHYDKQAVTL